MKTETRPARRITARLVSNSIKEALARNGKAGKYPATQEELSECVGASYRQISRIVLAEARRKQNGPSLLLAVRIGQALGVPVTKLFQIEVQKKIEKRPKKRSDAA